MLRGLYTATSAMKTNQRKMDVITNNISNANTVGYKKDLVLTESFPQVLIHRINSGIDTTRREVFKGVEVQQENGFYSLATTGGFFRTKTPNGTSHEGSINFTINQDGYLSTYYKDSEGRAQTDTGYLVMGNGGPIYVGDGQLEINDRGQVLVDGNLVDNLVMQLPPYGIGTLNDGVRLDRLEINFQQGQLFETGNTLDAAIRGKGFFQVETQEGLRYTRDGSFKLNQNNELVTTEGYRILGTNGPIVLNGEKVAFSPMGEVIVNDQTINRLNIIDIDNIKDLRKIGGNLFKIEDNMQLQTRPFQGEVVQGFLENSNVDAIKEMVEMMTMFRNHESSQRVIKAYDDLLQRAVNEVGKV